ncbi:MAG TPA: GyrI-like domain-containing protein [Anaerolineales bacterium]
MIKLDLKKDLKRFYAPSAKRVELVDLPEWTFLMIDGAIEPGTGPGTSPGFQEAIQAVYGAAYTLKFALKLREAEPVDYPVMPLEGLWWVEDGHFDIREPGNWKYTLMILQPDVITSEQFNQAVARLSQKKPSPALDRLRLAKFQEGLCIQTLHLGPYASEPDTVAKMHAFAGDQGLAQQGKHHEIYLGNPLRADASKLKTILRLPVARV